MSSQSLQSPQSPQSHIDKAGQRLREIASLSKGAYNATRLQELTMLVQEDLGRIRTEYLKTLEPYLSSIDASASKIANDSNKKQYLMEQTRKIRKELLK